MQLDKRFKVLPFCCFGTDKKVITNHIGKKGYFANTISYFSDIKFCKYGTLGSVLDDRQESFYMSETGETFSFFIPECFVKPKEKKYRPYTLQEFLQKIPIGKPIIFRQKGTTKYEKCLIINGYSCEDWSGLPTPYICIGNIMYSLDALFIDYEYKNDYTEDFKPFGVEVEE